MRHLILPALVLSAAVGCAPLERSRNLNDPQVPPKALAQQICASCHGINGQATSPNFPNLAAQPRDYIVAQLKGFRTPGRSDPPGFEYMWGISKHLTDDQIEGLADYFSSQPSPTARAAPARDDAVVEVGRKLFQNGIPDREVPACSACHGDHAQGAGQFPRLAGQHSDYLTKQLVVFQRTNQRPSGAVMKAVSHNLSDADIRAVATYLQSEPGS
jgi:cytochrome c553